MKPNVLKRCAFTMSATHPKTNAKLFVGANPTMNGEIAIHISVKHRIGQIVKYDGNIGHRNNYSIIHLTIPITNDYYTNIKNICKAVDNLDFAIIPDLNWPEAKLVNKELLIIYS